MRAQPRRVNIDANGAMPLSLHVPDDGLGVVEALTATTEPAAEVEVFEGSFEHHVMNSRQAQASGSRWL